MDLPLDDDMLTGSEMYTTARESSEDEGMDSVYATPRAHSILPLYPVHPTLHLHIPGSFQESSEFLMSVQLTNDVDVVSSPKENSSTAEPHPDQSTPGTGLSTRDGDDNMYEQVQFSHLLSSYPPLTISF